MPGDKLFRYLQPNFFSGLLDDPVLVVNIRPTGRAVLFDCGQIHHLAKRVLRSIDAVFISHAHMDHFMGLDHLIRNVHVAPRTIRIFGPPGISKRFEHKVLGYDWNLTEETWCNFEVTEVHQQTCQSFLFRGSQGFHREELSSADRVGAVIYRDTHLTVEATLCDHKIPVLIFRVTEKPGFRIDRPLIRAEQLKPGDWLRELKRRFHQDDWDCGPLTVECLDRSTGRIIPATEVHQFYRQLGQNQPPARLGYISDIGYTPENIRQIEGLMQGLELLYVECTFLSEDMDKARVSAHLCTADVNQLAKQLRPKTLVPMHLSKSYIKEPTRLYKELDLPLGTSLVELPAYRTPRPLLPGELA